MISKFITVLRTFIKSAFLCVLLVHAHLSQAEELFNHVTSYETLDKPLIEQVPNSDEIIYTIMVDGQPVQFELNDNKRLTKNLSSKSKQVETRFLRGKIKGNQASWARLTYQNGVMTGAYYDGESLFFIDTQASLEQDIHFHDLSDAHQLNTTPEKSDRHTASQTVLFNANDMEHNGSCALHDHSDSHSLTGNQFRYDAYVNELQTMMVNGNASKEISITLVADPNYVNSSSDASAEMLSELNVADGIFSEQLGIQITAEDTQELSELGTLDTTDASDLIVAFRQLDIPNPGLSHLFTGRDLNGTTVGIAYVGALCNSFAVGVTQRFGTATALVFTHELGHNFGAPHDNQSGSACASTPNGFIMNPRVNRNATEFSACSVERMAPVIERASNGFGACIVDTAPSAPTIISTANVSAQVGEAYLYDSDATVDVSDGASVSFNLDISPSGMSIDGQGRISWTPSASQVGINPVQVSIQNVNGSDTQFFDIEVVAADEEQEFINFQNATFSRFADQYKRGDVITNVSPNQLELTGNNWQSIPFDYQITRNTVVEFEFRSDVEAEIQGIAFENDNGITSERTFNVYGSQSWGFKTKRYTGNGAFQAIEIPLGDYLDGSINRLVFMVDNDSNISGANSVFKNVRVYESTEASPLPLEITLNLNDYSFGSHENQDGQGTVEVIDSGAGITLKGNRWRKIKIDTFSIAPYTILEFEFKSSQIGEIHGLGFLPGSSTSPGLVFNVHGTQAWGIRDFSYSGNGEYQTFNIPIGQYFTQNSVELVFIMDHDVSSPDGESTFRNIKFSNFRPR